MIKSKGFEKSEKTKSQKSKKVSSDFSPPKQTDVILLLNVNAATFKSKFKAYQKAAGIAVNWTKLDEEQYD